MPANPPQRCTATTATGRPCRAWSVPGTDPPLCSAHGGRRPEYPRPCPSSQAEGTRHAGAPPGNQNARAHGFYSAALELHELADLVACADDLDLDDEIACTRIILRRLMAQIRPPTDDCRGEVSSPDPAGYARLAGLALQATRTVARLLRDKRALTGDAADGLMGILGQALDELAAEWGIEL